MASYAQLGKAELIQAIGVISDYEEKLGIELSVENGEAKTSIAKRKHSEKEQYGEKERLSTAPLLFWMYLHYLSPDQQGLVRNVSLEDAAKYLNLSVKGIRKAITKLSDTGYIYSSEIINNTVTIMLPDFENYFKQKDQCGHGYLELSENNFLSIIVIAKERMVRGTKEIDKKYENKSLINKIRIKIRSFIMCDHAQRLFKRNKKANTMVEKSIKQMLSFLPKYIYRKKLIELLESISDVISYVVLPGCVKMQAFVADFNGVRERNSQIRTHCEHVKKKLECIDKTLKNYDFAPEKDKDFSKLADSLAEHDIYLNDEFKHGYYHVYSENEIKDIAKLCLQYTEEIVFEALGYMYSNFTLLGRNVNNIGALLRTLIRSYCF